MKTIKAWAIIQPDSTLAYGMQCQIEKDGEILAAVYSSLKQARVAMREHKIFFGDAKMREIVISYSIPKKKNKKK